MVAQIDAFDTFTAAWLTGKSLSKIIFSFQTRFCGWTYACSNYRDAHSLRRSGRGEEKRAQRIYVRIATDTLRLPRAKARNQKNNAMYF
ncbi:hypothetical protein RB195_020436 [Necator americanus]|uniref:Uncharacterized protein n=1 Tax=Necator americanus TaxID=51031 RepID=A0ABR1CIU9_NECAM